MRFLNISLLALIFLITTFISNPLFAQDRFAEGYIIDLQNDTLHGILEIQGEKLDSRVCHFKTSEKSPLQKFSPNEIKAFRFKAGRFMISKTIDIGGKPETVFLEYLIKGKASLYQHPGETAPRYFIETEKDGMIELSEPQKIIHNDSGAFYNISKHNGKLLYLMADCPEIKKEIEQTPLRPKPMIKLANRYHDLVCTDEVCVVFERRYKKVEYLPSVSAGFAIKRVKFGSGLYSDFMPAVNAGAALEVRNLFSHNERITLETGLNISRINQTVLRTPTSTRGSEHIIIGNKNYYVNNREELNLGDFYIKVFSVKAELKLTSLTVPLIMKYNFHKSRSRAGFGLGPLLTFNISENKDMDYPFFTSRFGRNIPGTLAGATVNVFYIKKLNAKSSFKIDLRYMTDFLVGDIQKTYRFRTQVFQANLSYNFFW